MKCVRCGRDHFYWECPDVVEDARVNKLGQEFRRKQKIEEELEKIRKLLEKSYEHNNDTTNQT